MRKLLTFLIALVALALPVGANAWWQSIQQVAVSSALPGPPTFAFQSLNAGSDSANVATFTGVSIGTASANRFVVMTVGFYNGFSGGAITGVSWTGGTASFVQMTNDANASTFVVYGTIPTGTTTTLTVTFTSAVFTQGVAWPYTTDVTTLASTTPVTAGAVVASGTTQTASIPIANNGSALFFIAANNGATNNSQTISASDAGLGTDGIFGSNIAGSKNNVALSAASHVTETWTTSATNDIGFVVFR
jgi:hypothetical protein